MVAIVIGAIALVIIILYMIFRDVYGEEVEFIAATIVIAFIVWGFSLLIAHAIADPGSTYEYKHLPIQSAYSSTSQGFSGSFILGCGTVSGSTESVYIVQGNFKQGMLRIELDTDYTYVNETDAESPKIKNYYSRKITPAYSCWWLSKDHPREVGSWKRTSSWDEKVLIVPANTVRKQFDIK